VNPAFSLTWRDALHAMPANLIVEAGQVLGSDFKEDRPCIRAIAQDAVLSALAGGKANVAAHQVLRKVSCVGTTFGGPYFDMSFHILFPSIECGGSAPLRAYGSMAMQISRPSRQVTGGRQKDRQTGARLRAIIQTAFCRTSLQVSALCEVYLTKRPCSF
jgi:hypothetical protein